MIRKLLPLLVLASPALAEPITESGYLIGCSEKMCKIAAAGFTLTAGRKSTDPEVFAFMQAQAPLTAVSFEGELGTLGDATAPVKVTYIETLSEDPYQDTLRYIQGDWVPLGDTSGYFIRIKGMEWQDMIDGQVSSSFLIQPSDTCTSGVQPGGIALNLVPIGGDPSWAICWKIDYATDTEMDLSDFSGEQGQISLLRK